MLPASCAQGQDGGAEVSDPSWAAGAPARKHIGERKYTFPEPQGEGLRVQVSLSFHSVKKKQPCPDASSSPYTFFRRLKCLWGFACSPCFPAQVLKHLKQLPCKRDSWRSFSPGHKTQSYRLIAGLGFTNVKKNIAAREVKAEAMQGNVLERVRGSSGL